MLVEEFLLGEDKLGHGTIFNHSKTVVKKAASKRQGGFLLLSGQVIQFKCEKRLLFTGKRNRVVFTCDLERVNEFYTLEFTCQIFIQYS